MDVVVTGGSSQQPQKRPGISQVFDVWVGAGFFRCEVFVVVVVGSNVDVNGNVDVTGVEIDPVSVTSSRQPQNRPGI